MQFNERIQARRIALQALYQLDVQGDDFLPQLQEFINETTEDPKVRDMAVFITNGAWRYRSAADAWINRLAPAWPVQRMPTVDRSVLRLAAWELTHVPAVPVKVALDEALNLAKEFSTADSGAFVNGVLDAMAKEHIAQTGRSWDKPELGM